MKIYIFDLESPAILCELNENELPMLIYFQFCFRFDCPGAQQVAAARSPSNNN